jgi:hypothetical protein
MIYANCRMRLTADDFTFVVGVLSKSESDHVSLVKLLIDEDTRDAILDHDMLAKAILESPQRLPISPQLLFYVLCRKVLRDTKVRSREAADFVASVLEGFMRTARMEPSKETGKRSMQYLSDIMHAMNNAGTREAFLLRACGELRPIHQRNLRGQRGDAYAPARGARSVLLRGSGPDELPGSRRV